MKFKITLIVLIIASLIWFGLSALLVFLASLIFDFKMSIIKVLLVFVAGIVIRGFLPSRSKYDTK